MSKLSDLGNVIQGKDLEGEAQENTPKTKPGKDNKKAQKDKTSKDKKDRKLPGIPRRSKDVQKDDTPARTRKSSSEALISAYEYAASEQVNKDLTAALKGKPPATDLRLLLEVLVDNQHFREFLLSQCEVKEPEADPEPDSEKYEIAVQYLNAKGMPANEDMVKNIYEMGQTLEDWHIKERYYRLGENGKDLGDASKEEIEAFKKAS